MKLSKFLKERVGYSFYPVRCPYCDRVIEQNDIACRDCAAELPDILFKRYANGGHICAAALPYADKYAAAVRRMKFYNRADLIKPLAAQVVQAVLGIIEDKSFDLVTCVPMHEKDRKQRGYNQAELLAMECAEIMELPFAETLEKFKRNRPQHQTSGLEREKNVRGVFRLIDGAQVKGKHVLLIDDIITTGSTLGECARILYKGKCRFVSCAVICTTVNSYPQKSAD